MELPCLKLIFLKMPGFALPGIALPGIAGLGVDWHCLSWNYFDLNCLELPSKNYLAWDCLEFSNQYQANCFVLYPPELPCLELPSI